MGRTTTTAVAFLLAISCFGQNDWCPEIHGTIRGKYEYQPEVRTNRFEVRNARFSISGRAHPLVDYKAEIDLSDEGSIRMLDAYTRLSLPTEVLSLTIGQMRVPFTIDAHRSPHQQYFANRSFIAKQVGNVRDVGFTVAYLGRGDVPLLLEGGLFNGSGLTNQKVWHKTLNYALKAQLFPGDNWNLTLGTQLIKPEDVRIGMYNADLYYQGNRFHVEAEYLYKTYAHHAFKNVHAVNGFANYDLPLKKVFSKISFLVRYDMMTDHSAGKADAATAGLVVDDYARHRATGGVTLSLAKAFIADIRLNVEKYFYKKSAIVKESERDKIVIEFMTRF